MAADAILLAFQSIKTATDLLGALRQAEKSYEAAEFKLRIADLTTAIAETKIQLADVQDYVRELEKKVATRESLTFDRETSVYRSADGDPFCPKCLEGDGKACRMHEGQQLWTCFTCERKIFRPGYPKPVAPRRRHTARSFMSE